MSCPHCGGPIPGGGRRNRVYCGQQCRRKAEYARRTSGDYAEHPALSATDTTVVAAAREAVRVGEARGWPPATIGAVMDGLGVLLAGGAGGGQLTVSEVRDKTPAGVSRVRVEQVLTELGLLVDDTTPPIRAWIGYHTDARERPLMWIGEGLSAFGVEGLAAGRELTEDQFEMARRLIRGQHPTSEAQLVTPKVAVPAAAKVSLGPLVAAVTEAAAARGVEVAGLFDGPVLARGWAVAERGVAARGGRAVARVDEAAALARAAGLDPATVWGAERVEAARAALYVTREKLDVQGRPVLGADGAPVVERVAARERVGIAGYDIGITVPKSMSVLLAMAPEEMATRIEGIYAQAATDTFAWTEARTSYVKRGKHGNGHTARHEQTPGFSGWVMTHRAARPVGEFPIGDPHWHVHITIANMAQAAADADGERKWLTIASGGRDLMRHAPAIDKITQALVRSELNAQFGITFARSGRTGVWEVAHIPERVNELFSKRGAQVTKALEALGYAPGEVSPKESRTLTRACRSGKSETTAEPDVTLREYWRAQAIAAGYDPAAWMPQVLAGYQAGNSAGTERANETMEVRYGISFDDVVARLSHPEDGLTAHSRRFSHLDAITAVADALPYLPSETEIVALTDLVLANPAFVPLPDKTSEHAQLAGSGTQLAGSHDMIGGQLYTTQGVIEAEQAILGRVKTAASETGYAVVPTPILEMAIGVAEAQQGYRLSAEQRTAVAATVGSGAGLGTIEGPAGTGKTTMMRAARIAYEAAGYTVGGAATAAVAAQGLQAESGIGSRTVAGWKLAIESAGGTAGLDVLILDEATLTDDQDRAALYEAARVTRTAVREVGDPKQLRAPGTGSSFGYIHAVLNGPRLTDNRRQQDEDARAAVAAWRDGRYLESLRGWDARGGIVATQSTDEAVAVVVERWMRAAQGAPDPHTQAAGLLTLAATNEQVTRLNQAIQGARAQLGQLGESQAFALPGGRSVTFHIGDQVIIRANDRHTQLGSGEAVLNGYRGVVTGLSPAGVTLEWRQPDDKDGQAPHTGTRGPRFIAEGGVDLGYCLTGHKSQGMTTKAGWDRPDGTRNRGTTLVWGPGMDAAGGYVQISRAAGDTVIVAPLQELENDRDRIAYGTPHNQDELTERAIAAIASKAAATGDNPNDTPVLVDLGHAPSAQDWRIHHGTGRSVAHGAEPVGQAPAVDTEAAHTREYDAEPGRAQDQDVTQDVEQGVEQGVEQDEVGQDQVGQDQVEQDRVEQGQAEQEAEQDQAVKGDQYTEVANEVGPGETQDTARELELDDDDQAGSEVREPVEVTAEQRQRWEQLHQQTMTAWRDGDPDAQQAAWAEWEAYETQLGADVAGQLQRDALAQAEQVAVERAAYRPWQEREYGTLTAEQLTEQLAQAQRSEAGNREAAEQARAHVETNAPLVEAGQGQRVTALDRQLDELRRRVGQVTEAREAASILSTATWQQQQAARTAQELRERAAGIRFRPGAREKLHEQAEQQQAAAWAAQQRAEKAAQRLEQIREEDPALLRDTESLARDRVAAAEARYPQDREQAQRLDVGDLDSAQRRIGWSHTAADTAAAKVAELTGEAALRTQLVPDLAETEQTERGSWHEQQQREAAQRRAVEAERQREQARTYVHEQAAEHDHGMDYGM